MLNPSIRTGFASHQMLSMFKNNKYEIILSMLR